MTAQDYAADAANVGAVVTGTGDVTFPTGGWSWRVDLAATKPDAPSLWWPTTTAKTVCVDTDRYEAFPFSHTFGRKVWTAWSTSSDHYGDGTANLAWSSDGRFFNDRMVVASPGGTDHNIVGMASLGGRMAVYHKTTGGKGWVTVLSDPLGAWPAATQVTWGDAVSWTFPTHLAWIDDGTTDGLMLATCYGGDGVSVAKSVDAGTTWQALATPCPGTPTAWKYTETSITHLGGTDLLMVVRWEEPGIIGPASELRTLKSSDMGQTWTTPQTMFVGTSGQPAVTKTVDGALLVTIRDARNGGNWAPWSYAVSLDDGNTWGSILLAVNEWMMYGNFVTTHWGGLVLIGASQYAVGVSDVWSMPFTPEQS